MLHATQHKLSLFSSILRVLRILSSLSVTPGFSYRLNSNHNNNNIIFMMINNNNNTMFNDQYQQQDRITKTTKTKENINEHKKNGNNNYGHTNTQTHFAFVVVMWIGWYIWSIHTAHQLGILKLCSWLESAIKRSSDFAVEQITHKIDTLLERRKRSLVFIFFSGNFFVWIMKTAIFIVFSTLCICGKFTKFYFNIFVLCFIELVHYAPPSYSCFDKRLTHFKNL